MLFSAKTLLSAAVALSATPFANALGTIFVDNHCNFPVYAQHITAQSASGLITLPANRTNAYNSPYLHSTNNRASIYFNTSPNLDRHFQYDYNYNPTDQYSLIYYDLSVLQGDPLQAQGFSLATSDPRGHAIHCPAGVAQCPDVWNPSGNGPVFSVPNTSWTVIYLCQS